MWPKYNTKQTKPLARTKGMGENPDSRIPLVAHKAPIVDRVLTGSSLLQKGKLHRGTPPYATTIFFTSPLDCASPRMTHKYKTQKSGCKAFSVCLKPDGSAPRKASRRLRNCWYELTTNR